MTNEIVRQLLEQQGFYSLDKPIGDMKYIVDTRCVEGTGAGWEWTRRAARWEEKVAQA